jgi:hypothetical protein
MAGTNDALASFVKDPAPAPRERRHQDSPISMHSRAGAPQVFAASPGRHRVRPRRFVAVA